MSLVSAYLGGTIEVPSSPQQPLGKKKAIPKNADDQVENEDIQVKPLVNKVSTQFTNENIS